MSMYPDGCPGPRRGVAEYSCPNSDCDTRRWDVDGVFDLGDFTPNDETDTACPGCGQEGE